MATVSSTSSGSLDIASLVSAYMAIERTPITRMQNDNALQQRRLSSWNGVDTAMVLLRDKVTALKGSTSWGQMAATVTQSGTVMAATASVTAVDNSYDVNVTSLARSFSVYGDAQATAGTALGFTGEFFVQGDAAENKITVEASDSLNTIAGKINTASDAWSDSAKKVRASVVANQLVLETEAMGKTTTIALSDGGVPDGILQAGKLGLLNDAEFRHTAQTGTDLELTMNGISVSRQTNTDITDVLAGVTLGFSATGSATLLVARDTATIRSQIQGFVDAYNSAMTKVRSEATATTGSGGTIASAGPLQGDSLLREISSRCRAMVTATATGEDISADFTTLRQIGVWTAGSENQLTIDSTALTAALENHPDEVEALLRDPEAGLITQFGKYLDGVANPVDGALKRRKDTITGTIRATTTRISTVQARLDDYEDTLYERFARLQETLDNLNKQLSYVSSLKLG